MTVLAYDWPDSELSVSIVIKTEEAAFLDAFKNSFFLASNNNVNFGGKITNCLNFHDYPTKKS